MEISFPITFSGVLGLTTTYGSDARSAKPKRMVRSNRVGPWLAILSGEIFMSERVRVDLTFRLGMRIDL